MDQPPDDPLTGFVVLATLLASVATWIALIARWRGGKPLLEYEPRSPVPWGAAIAMLAVVFVAITLLTPSGSGEQPAPLHPVEATQRLVGFILFQSVVIGGVLAIVTVFYRASLRDLGLPVYADEFVRDVRLGIITSLAALAPVYGVQLLMLFLFGPSKHPLVEMVTSGEPNVGIVFLASIAAVVVAPVSEEILFRLLLQGCLEKWEDEWRVVLRNFGFRFQFRLKHLLIATAVLAIVLTLMTLNVLLTLIALLVIMLAAGLFFYSLRHQSAMTNVDPDNSLLVVGNSTLENASPACDVPAGTVTWPYGWPPILISSLLFAIAHSGYGPDPIAIFVLAIILGYVYRRTHRIVPCMVAHALFNSVAMLILWRMVLLQTE